jgi:hypothetical protein
VPLVDSQLLTEGGVLQDEIHMNNIFRGFWQICVVLCTFACAPALAQVQFQGSLTTNTVGVPVMLASPVYYAETVTALTTVAPGTMTCSTYPVAQVRLKRSGTDSQIGFISVAAGTSTAGTIAIPSLQVGDVVYGSLQSAGVGCTNELPIQVSFTAQYVAKVSTNLTNLVSGANAFIDHAGGSGPESAERDCT